MKIELYPKTEVGSEMLKDYSYVGNITSTRMITTIPSFLVYVVECPSTYNANRRTVIILKAINDPNFDYKIIDKEENEYQ